MIPFSPPRIDQKIIDEVVDTLKSGWITTGPKTKLLEKKLSEFCGNPNTVCLNSATAGLEIILRWFGVTEGDEVILPAYTYAATANVIIHCGATPVFVDVNPDDFNINVKNIEKAITSNTKVIMPVDFGGFPCAYNEINDMVKQNQFIKIFNPATEEQKKLGRIMILSDAAHSIGARYNKKKTGSLTDVTVFSFHAVKNFTTAEGGAICLNLPAPFDNEEIYKALSVKILHGQNKDALAKTQKGNWKYDIIEAGYKYNMTDIMAAFGLVEIQRYDDDTVQRRKDICKNYSKILSKYTWAEIPVFKSEKAESCYHLYPLRIKGITEAQRDKIVKEIFEQDISVNVHFIPVPMMSFYKKLGYNISNYPVAFDNYSREISLPVFYDLQDNQVEHVTQAVIKSVNKVIGE